MAEVVPDTKSRNLQQSVTHSKWSDREVIDYVAGDADELLGDVKDTCVLIAESGFVKQSKASVSVARQWLGRLGKVDNGQLAVFGAMAKSQYGVAIDVRLYLNES
jgi:SRSO17 transposase